VLNEDSVYCNVCGDLAPSTDNEELKRLGWRVTERWNHAKHCCVECRSREVEILDRPVRRRA
jgi:hypothetical protein